MADNQPNQEEFLITLNDVKAICKKNQKKIYLIIGFFALIASLYTLTRPVTFTADASFKEKSRANAGSSKSLSEMLVGAAANQENEAASAMKSKDLIASVIRRLGLQANLVEKGTTYGPISNIWRNLWVQYAYLFDWERPVFKVHEPNLIIQGVEYTGDRTINLTLKFVTEDTFIINGPGISDETRWLGAPIIEENFRFTLIHTGQKPLIGSVFNLSLKPLDLLANKMSKSIKIKTDKTDKTLLLLTYKHTTRSHAKKVLDELMAGYQDYLRDEHNKSSQTQLDYLQKRQEESFQKQVELMEAHAIALADDISTTGISDTEKEMEFFLKQQQQYAHKLDAIILEIKRLEHSLKTGTEASSLAVLSGEKSPVHQLLQNAYELKQQRDSLSLALRQHSKSNPNDMEKEFVSQANDFEEICTKSNEIEKVINCLVLNIPADESYSVFRDPQLLVNHWYQKLNQLTSKEEKEKQKEQFLSYLNNLNRLYSVHKNLIEERLAHHYRPQQQFEGITLETAGQLYMTYSKEYDKLEASIRRNNFILNQMDDPNFEVFSLASVLDDSVSREIIKKSSELSLLLRDENNRTHKEHERVRSELEIQKRFLKAHLTQSVDVLKLNSDLYQEKMVGLQNVMVGLIHQNISVLQKQISEYIYSRLENLYQEQELINKHLVELHQRMARIPNKWVWEQIVKRTLTMNQALAEEITRLVEGKNISNHLEVIQSAPVDTAHANILPDSPLLLLYVVLGSIFGTFVGIGIFVTKAIVKGIPVSEENLKIVNQQVAGHLSRSIDKSHLHLMDTDLATLRRLTSFLKEIIDGHSLDEGKTVLVVEGHEVNYVPTLLELLHKKGVKSLVIPLNFDRQEPEENLPGLLQYLQHNHKHPKIIHEQYYHRMSAGGIHRFSPELVTSPAFKTLIDDLNKDYDLIIATTKSEPSSAETEALVTLFDAAIITLRDESVTELKGYFTLDKPIIFVFED